jgi:hypothetical protein
MNQITKKHLVLAGIVIFSCIVSGCNQTSKKESVSKDYYVAAYIWPSCHDEPRVREYIWPEGIGEWEVIKKGNPRYEGHYQPKEPLWGFEMDNDPKVVEKWIDVATDYGVNVFIYDWYWYDNRPFLEQCLNDSFLGAANSKDMRFYIMWANHTATSLWDLRTSHENTPIWDGAVNFAQFQMIARRWMERYFCRENYYKIDGKPVLCIYDMQNFLRGLGGLEGAARAIEWLRDEMAKAGFPGLHLQLIKYGGEGTYEHARALGADSITHYQNVHYTRPGCDYSDWLIAMQAEFDMIDSHGIPYFPHVSLGWHSQPRFLKPQNDAMANCTPENIKKALQFAKTYIDAHRLSPPLVTVNSWNEWTETSYLQPDDVNGYGYLEAVREVFCDQA